MKYALYLAALITLSLGTSFAVLATGRSNYRKAFKK